jgi:3D (Asp-Asp-Asp) domain-containing protein
MPLAQSILAGIILFIPIICINNASAQLKIYSTEGVAVVGGSAGNFEGAGDRQTGKDWRRVYVAGRQGNEYPDDGDKPQGKKDMYLYATGYYHPEQGQDFYATGSYERDLRLNGRGITASGKKVSIGHVAVDPSFIPLGTEFYSEAHGILRAEDTGGRIKGNRIDIFTGNGEDGLVKARKINRWEKLKVVKWGPGKSSDDATLKGPSAEQKDPDMVPVAMFSNYRDYQRLIKRK